MATLFDALLTQAHAGDRRALGRLISIVEEDREGAGRMLAQVYSQSGAARRIGVTGAPGAGKSTLVSALIGHLRRTGATVAVIAVDPSSPFTGGAILGDRIRMQDHVSDAGVFVRSMGSRGVLGGLSAATPKATTILDAVGFDVIIIETVGVGQAEVEVMGEVDSTVVVVTPGWGDSVQANKSGLLEIADVFVVNKADRGGAGDALRDLELMLDLGPEMAWRPPIIETVAVDGTGVEALWSALEDHHTHLAAGELAYRRSRRAEHALRHAIESEIADRMTSGADGDLEAALAAVRSGERDPWTAARELVSRLD